MTSQRRSSHSTALRVPNDDRRTRVSGAIADTGSSATGSRCSAVRQLLLAWLALGGTAALAAASPSPSELSQLSIEELSAIEVTSVSKRAEPLTDAAAAVYVITSDEIRRSGATSLPEALRLAPNLQVARVDSSQYAISARGFNATTANKLLVLIDGRSTYTPLFSGVFWDVQSVLLEDIDRIEVISGPGGTLWGSNAVNGVINVVTRSANNTRGNLAILVAGNRERALSLRHGGSLGDDASFRVYASGVGRSATALASGADGQDAWHRRQGGFRIDWGRAGDELTLQGDAYDGAMEQPGNSDTTISGANLIGRWSRQLGDGSALQLQGYFDRTRRDYPGIFGEVLDTVDLEAQHRPHWRDGHDIVWGGGIRRSRDEVRNTAMLAFLPPRKSLAWTNLFVQDTIAIGERLHLTLGGKVEHNNYTGVEFQPNLRLASKLPSQGLLWATISRAVRTPSRIDREFFAPSSPPYLFAGGPHFVSEKLIAYEVGYRLQPLPAASLSVSAYYNDYRGLRSIEPIGGGASVLGNGIDGKTYGLEAWGSYQALPWWRVSLGASALTKRLRLDPGSRDGTSLSSADTDPSYQLLARSTMNLAHGAELDLALRSISSLPSQGVPQYAAFDARIGWTLSPGTELSVVANDLFDRRHREFGLAPSSHLIGRSVSIALRLER